MTIADDLRRAAHMIQSGCIADSPADDLAQRLRAHADELEAVEREMREWDRNILTVQRYADRIRGEK